MESTGLHALLAAVDRARISVRAPFRLFNDLMATDWMTREVKREFCRGLLACSPEAQRLKERAEALHASIHADPERVLQYPMMWLELICLDLRRWLPGLQRHARMSHDPGCSRQNVSPSRSRRGLGRDVLRQVAHFRETTAR